MSRHAISNSPVEQVPSRLTRSGKTAKIEKVLVLTATTATLAVNGELPESGGWTLEMVGHGARWPGHDHEPELDETIVATADRRCVRYHAYILAERAPFERRPSHATWMVTAQRISWFVDKGDRPGSEVARVQFPIWECPDLAAFQLLFT